MRKMMSAAIAAAIVCSAAAAFAQAPTPQPDPSSPNYQATGEQDKSYVFPGTDEKIPYHIYVPMKWTKTTKLPLIISLPKASMMWPAPCTPSWPWPRISRVEAMFSPRR